MKKPGNPFLKNQQIPYITVNQSGEIVILPGTETNVFMTTLGLKDNDVIQEINGTKYTVENIYDMIMASMNWKEGDAITIKIKRGGSEQMLKGVVKIPTEDIEGYTATDASKTKLREAWLKG